MPSTIRVLIVDDEERFRETLARLLKAKGFDATAAAGAQEALDLLARESFHVALLDVKMPGMGGLEALEAMKRLAPSLEVLALTGHASMDVAAAMLERGAANYFLKPCPVGDLADAILQAVDRAKVAGGGE
ncbi:response regulator [Megalodesulfovibrio gigas]|uniref:Putative response regulator receiver protein n=1 Tax=Megalodesulfovibrio gigas (strain ATCC 19364 / DSM 1382 / NCIMB 9332 / VKM B-1759) TaxID=1121448 RepID=T2GDV0_MEGG1|nr:response regulator [Megalodesulfovibrio gigas]AGW14765.1 putative response regulator receiver protein [Megalodesulfovibrio gigas DSM 1382 = ATCC 19364]